MYAALGASETAGTGLNDLSLRSRYAWPQLFFNAAPPRAATYYNFAVPGITTQDAVRDEVPAALAVHPAVVTVFFNIDDLINGVSPADFEAHLQSIVQAMRQGGRARVLVGNAPTIDHLPAFMACEGLSFEGVRCPVPAGVPIPSQVTVDATVNAYDIAIAEVVRREGAVLVDVRARSDELTTHPEYVSADGLHPESIGRSTPCGTVRRGQQVRRRPLMQPLSHDHSPEQPLSAAPGPQRSCHSVCRPCVGADCG